MRLLDEHWMDALSVARTREWDFEREVQLVNEFRDDFPDPMRFDHATPDPVEMDSGERPFGMPPNLDDSPTHDYEAFYGPAVLHDGEGSDDPPEDDDAGRVG